MIKVGAPAPDFELAYFKGGFKNFRLSNSRVNGLFYAFTPVISLLSEQLKCLQLQTLIQSSRIGCRSFIGKRR